jgi:acyl-CoA thioesterase-2
LNIDLSALLANLRVERVDKYLFIGRSPRKPERVFGGQVLGQALNSAIRTVSDERIAHSLHAYFLRPGNPQKQIVYEVDPIRDGRSFTTRRVVAKQEGKAIFNASISFQLFEEGLEHQVAMPDVPSPESLESDADYFTRLAEQRPDMFRTPRMSAIDRRPVNRRDYLDPQPTEPVQHIWFRAVGELGDEPCVHQTLLAFMSDFALLGAALLPHPYTGHSKDLQLASLDHGLWFHRPFRADEYLLYSLDGPSAGAGRGFSRGQFFSQDGRLVASTVQESLIRRQ